MLLALSVKLLRGFMAVANAVYGNILVIQYTTIYNLGLGAYML